MGSGLGRWSGAARRLQEGDRGTEASVTEGLILWATVTILRFWELPSTGVVQMGSGDAQGPAVAVQVT